MKKTVAILLLALMCVTLFAGCSNEVKTPVDTTTAEPVSTNNSWYPDDGPTYLPNEKFEGYSFTILMAGLSINDFNDFSNENGDGYSTVNDAILRRNLTVEERYGISLNVIQDFSLSWGDGNSTGYKRVVADYMANESSYDLCGVGTFDAPQFAVNGYLLDLNDVQYIDLSRPWWDHSVQNDLGAGGKMFYSTGEISIIDNIANHCILFNKKLASENNITDLYSLVESGEWTLDKFIEYCKSISKDLDGNDIMDEKDLYGLMSWNDCLQASFGGSKSRIATVNPDGKIELTLYSEKNVDLVNKLTGLVFDRNYSFNYVNRSKTKWQTAMIDMFSSDHALFYTTYLSTVPALRDSNTDFGILPYPKYNLEQEGYGGYIPATYSVMYCIETTAIDPRRTGIITEALAYESMKTVTPAFYDQTLIGRFIRDDESAECLDIIFGNRSFDLGMYYKVGDYTGKLTNMMKAENNTFLNIYESNKTYAQAMIDELNFQFGATSK